MEESVIPLESKRVKVYCFGNTVNGELGLGGIDEINILAPRKQKSAQLNRKNYSIKQISCGRHHTLMLLTTPTIMKGYGEESEVGQSSIVISCGSNEMMQLGRNGSWKKFEPVENLGLHLVDQVACGANHSLALTAAGQVFSWGCNLFGQCGVPSGGDDGISRPALIKKLALETVVQISCGGNHSLALTNTGTLYVWGSNAFGQLGTGSKGNCELAPVQIVSLKPVPIMQIVAGSSHSLALSYTNALYAWGKNEFGQLGLGDTIDRAVPTLQKSLRNQHICSVSCGDEHSAALTLEGGLFTWGAGMYGQLGHGKSTNELLPRRVFELMGTNINQVACGRCHTLAVDGVRGRLYSFGLNGTGQLGLGTQVTKLCPIKVDGPWAELTAKELALRQMSGPVILKQEKPHIVPKSIQMTAGEKFESSEMSELQEGGLIKPPESMVVDDVEEVVDKEDLLDEEGSPRRSSLPLVDEPEEDVAPNRSRQDSDIEIKEYESDPDSDCEDRKYASHPGSVARLGSRIQRRRQLRLLTAIAGRGDHSFALTADLGDDIIVNDLRAIKSSGPLSVLDNEKLERLLPTVETCKIPIEVIEYIETTFGSVASWNASYISDAFLGSELLPRIDWIEARKGFSLLQNVSNSGFTEILTNVVRKVLLEVPKSSANLDAEIFRIFLLIRFLPCFELKKDNHQDALQLAVDYAGVFVKLDNESRDILKTWFATIDNSMFEKLVEDYQTCVKSVISSEAYQKEVTRQWELFNRSSYIHPNYLIDQKQQDTLKYSLEMLKYLYEVNESTNLISYKNFYIKELSEKNIIFMDYGYYKSHATLTQSRITLFCVYPFILEPGAKMLALEIDSLIKQMSRQEVYMVPTVHNQVQVYSEPAFLDLHVYRCNLIRSTIDQLCRTDRHRREDFKKMLRVNFVGEEAIDAGSGMKKEFFLLVMKEALNMTYGMFTEYSESRTIWFNGAMNDMYTEDDFAMYDMIGVICGLAIYNRVILCLPFPLPLYKRLLDEPLSFEDLGALDPTLHRNLKSIIDTPYGAEEFDAIYADINFVIIVNKFDTAIEDELCPGGKDRILKFENRHEYVELYWKYILIKSIERQYQSFKSGFLKVMDKEVLKLFNAEELLQLIIGKQEYDWEILEKVAVYKEPFSATHPTIVMFWKVFRSLNHEEKKKFLLFLTGSDRIPIIGMKHVEIRIQSMKVSSEHLPVAHTCFNLLDLPETYTDEDVLKSKLLQAIEHTQGFSLA